VDLIGAHLLQSEPIRRAPEILAEPRHRMDVGSLRRRRQIADRPGQACKIAGMRRPRTWSTG
jgi:hypothetical protein